MNKFIFEITEDEKSFRVAEVKAIDLDEAFKLFNLSGDACQGEEFVYQVCKKFEGAELPQPVYDFFNGSALYRKAKETS